jgi:hypothetical protein
MSALTMASDALSQGIYWICEKMWNGAGNLVKNQATDQL